MKKFEKIAVGALSVVVVVALCIPAISFASSGGTSDPDGMQEVQEPRTIVQPEGIQAADDNASADADASAVSENPATDCTATIKYYENVTYADPDIPPDANNQYLLGTRTITGLTEGQELNAWDYVINLNGFFFFDGWPARLTVSSDPSQNVIELFYGRLWNNSYTVNYYLMEGADLSADDWSGALAPDDVMFTKFASATFDNQPFGELVKGDAYEYQIDGAYAIDTYPAQIRVGTDADNDTINVLYVAQAATLPDDMEIIEGVEPPDNGGVSDGSNTGGSVGDSTIQAPSESITLPGDQTFDKDAFISILPDSLTKQEAVELFEDFIGSEEAQSYPMEITDEMAADTIDPEVAKQIIAAYNTGLEEGSATQNECTGSLVDHLICIVIMIALLIFMLVFMCMYLKERNRRIDLENKLQGGSIDASSGTSSVEQIGDPGGNGSDDGGQ